MIIILYFAYIVIGRAVVFELKNGIGSMSVSLVVQNHYR
jgi:hypothetical protein